MSDERTPNLDDLVQSLELRWRLVELGGVVTDALAISLGVSVLTVIARAAFALSFPMGRVLLVVNGAALVTALVVVAIRRRSATRFLVDADRAYAMKSLLVSGFEFGRHPTDPARDANRAAFERLVVEDAERKSEEVDPEGVYPRKPSRRLGAAAALVVALGILLILDASGWFDRPVPPYTDQALQLIDAGRKLAQRAGDDPQLQSLADELTRLGERVNSNDMTPDETRRQIDLLSNRIEEQIGNIERTPQFETNEDAKIPPESESTIRHALESGMSEGEIMNFFAQMRSQGNTVPDVVKSLEQATPDRKPDTNLSIDDDEMQRLLDQLNPPPASDEQSDIVNDLKDAQRVVQNAGSGLTQLSQGDNAQTGNSGDSGVGKGQQDESPMPEGSPMEGTDAPAGGQQGGTEAVTDQHTDTFQRPEDLSPVLREIHGVMTDNTIMDVIIRELPSQATSNLTEQQRNVLFERVVEEAVDRESTPPELQTLVRNYFLKLTRATEEGAGDEQ